MLLRMRPAPQQERQILAEAPASEENSREAELRRLMYERIARGNALAEIEENARRMWREK